MASKLFRSQEAGVLAVLAIVLAIFSLLSANFLTIQTLSGVLTASTEIGIVALGATLLISAGEFDLSVGSTFALCGMVFALCCEKLGLNSFAALAIALLCGALVGFVNGWVTQKTKIPSFITTLGSMLFWRGIVLLVTNGFPVSAMEPNAAMELFGTSLGSGFRSSIFVWVLLAVGFGFFLKHHHFGNWLLATGGNKDASFSMGINTSRVKLACFICSGVLAALAGVIQYSHLETFSPTAGEQYELRAIAISVIGGTLLIGGVGTIVGTVAGTLLMGVLASGLVQAGVSTYWFRSFVGLILVLAVVVNMKFSRWQNKEA